MSTTLLLAIGSILGGWAMLRCVGNERVRQVREIEDRIRAEKEAAEALAAAQAAAPKQFRA